MHIISSASFSDYASFVGVTIESLIFRTDIDPIS
jgi:hypothetical protein